MQTVRYTSLLCHVMSHPAASLLATCLLKYPPTCSRPMVESLRQPTITPREEAQTASIAATKERWIEEKAAPSHRLHSSIGTKRRQAGGRAGNKGLASLPASRPWWSVTGVHRAAKGWHLRWDGVRDGWHVASRCSPSSQMQQHLQQPACPETPHCAWMLAGWAFAAHSLCWAAPHMHTHLIGCCVHAAVGIRWSKQAVCLLECLQSTLLYAGSTTLVWGWASSVFYRDCSQRLCKSKHAVLSKCHLQGAKRIADNKTAFKVLVLQLMHSVIRTAGHAMLLDT